MNTEDRFQQIEQYLAGKLSGKDLSDFEIRLQQDHALQEEVRLHKEVGQTLKGEKIHAFRKVLQSVDQKWENPSKKSADKSTVFSLTRIISVAASILILALVYHFIFDGHKVSNDQLFAEHYTPYQMVLNQRGTVSDEEGLRKAITFYEQKDYKNAAIAFEQLYRVESDDIAIQFYLAISKLSAVDAELAISLFQNLLDQPTHLFSEQSRWFLAMAYLQKNKLSEAKAQLQEIQEGQFKYNAAQQILKQL